MALTILSVLALVLLAWQWAAGARFPLHRRTATTFAPAVSLLKPVKGCDASTEICFRSWFTQDYSGPVQILIGVESEHDPACAVARKLIEEFKQIDAALVICSPLTGANSKAAKLAFLKREARHDILVASDADVLAPPDLLSQMVGPLVEPSVGLATCFYRLQEGLTLGMKWEALAANVDFWSQVLQSNALKPMNFALGAVMALRRNTLDGIGGFEPLANFLADDYHLGNRIARAGFRVELCPVVVDCRGGEIGWPEAWRHQVRWARTIRLCEPVPYFFSILSNTTIWPLALLAAYPCSQSAMLAGAALALRVMAGLDLLRRFERVGGWKVSRAPIILLKDVLQAAVWAAAFLGSTVEWRGRRMVLRKGGVVVHTEACSRTS